MCLSIPRQVIEIRGEKAIVDLGGKKKGEVAFLRLMSVAGLKAGDYCLVSNGFIIKKIPRKEAEEIFNLIKPKKEG
jgi:hydrogenase assembly chaperone HypC/HupF